MHILDCTLWHRGKNAVGWAGDEMRWDWWGKIGIFCSEGKLACHSRAENFKIFRHRRHSAPLVSCSHLLSFRTTPKAQRR